MKTVQRCLGKNPVDRWPDGRSLKESLAAALGEDDDWLSGELREMSAGVFSSVVGGWVLGSVAWFGAVPLGKGRWLMVILAALTIAVSFLVTAVVHRRKGPTWAQLARVAKWPPKWWAFAWPRSWRRPGDIWDRLPTVVRWVRHFNGVLVGVTLLGAPFLLAAGPRAGLAALALLWAAMTSGMLGVAWWAHRTGFPNNADLRSLMLRSTTNKRFWRQHHVSRLLLPPNTKDGIAGAHEPGAPSEYLTAIANVAEQLTGPVREFGVEALAAARQLLDSMESLDAEIETLARDSNPTELLNVEQRLRALGEREPGEPTARDAMRKLLRGQHDLLRQLSAQFDGAAQRREHLRALMKTLWLQLAALRAETAADAAASSDVTGRIRANCNEIAIQAEGVATVRKLASVEAPGS